MSKDRVFTEKGGKKLYLVRCPKCGTENWGPAVATGQCAWCGYEAKIEDVRKEKKQ